MKKTQKLDDKHTKLIDFFKSQDGETGMTLREIATSVGFTHPQTVLNKLNQLVSKGYFVKDDNWFRLVRENIHEDENDIYYIPIYGFAQCGNQWKAIVEEYSQESIPVTLAFIWTKNLDNCFFVRAKWASMEPKIHDGDLVLIRQQDSYDIGDYIFIVHNQLPKLKKIIKSDDWSFNLKSINPLFDKVEISKFDESKVIWVVKKIIKNSI